MMIKVSRYYEIITPESAEDADAAERDEVYTGRGMSIRDAVREIRDSGIDQPSDSRVRSHTWLSSADPDRNYRDGSERYESLHFTRLDGTDLSAHQLQRIFRAARIAIRE